MYRTRTGLWGLTILALLVYFFLYAPILLMMVYSFNDSRLNVTWQGFTLQWYRSLWQNTHVLEALGNSLVAALASTLLSVALGTTAAYGFYRFRQKASRLLEGLIFIPLVVPDVVLGVSMLMLFVLLDVNLGLHTITVSHSVFGTAYVAVVVRSRLATLDRNLEQAAMDLGADWWNCFRRVIFPLILPGVVAGGLLAFTVSMDDFVVTFFTAGVGSTTLPLRIYSMLKLGVSPEVNALSTLLVIVIIFMLLATQLVLRGGSNTDKRKRRPTINDAKNL
ncbi:MAG: ABC transporter permease [Firmicutes bacterium]|nr:ABC transporter permease [Bacillota bacterium]